MVGPIKIKVYYIRENQTIKWILSINSELQPLPLRG